MPRKLYKSSNLIGKIIEEVDSEDEDSCSSSSEEIKIQKNKNKLFKKTLNVN